MQKDSVLDKKQKRKYKVLNEITASCAIRH